MNIDLINCIIKFIGSYLCIGYSFFKIIDYHKINIIQKIIITIASLLLSLLQYALIDYTNIMARVLLLNLFFSFILGKIAKLNYGNSIIINLISLALNYTISFITTIVTTILLYLVFNIQYTNPIILLYILFLNFIIEFLFFKIKRFNHGFPFVKSKAKDDYIDVFILAVISIMLFVYFTVNVLSDISGAYLIACFILLIIIMFVIIQKTIILLQKHKNMIHNIKILEHELSETKQKLSTALSEKQQLVKSNHEFYHRQEALNKKLDDLINQSKTTMNTEFAQEYSDILDRINNLSNEYANKTQNIPKLPISKIEEIDDMLSYMQSECIKNNIDFIVKIDYDIDNIIEKYITKSQLETLLGDLLRNAIIAINHSSNNFRSIMVVFGIKDNTYELCIYDSGIPFEIKTLLNLGLHPASTHENEGGTGIGFVTTFETLESCKSSLVINELSDNNYTKYLEIKFDGKNEYIIVSERYDEINKLNKNKRNIIIK